MQEETEKLLKWLVGNYDEYIERLNRLGYKESMETAYYCKETVQQFLDKPDLIKNL
jgi:predicted DNA-binding protein